MHSRRAYNSHNALDVFYQKNELVAMVTNGYKVKRLYMYDTSCENTPSCIMVVS